MDKIHLNPTPETRPEFLQRNIPGQVGMLNLLRLRQFADYSEIPNLALTNPISVEAAYQLYIDHTLPLLKNPAGEILFFGKGGPFLIRPYNENWDAVLLSLTAKE